MREGKVTLPLLHTIADENNPCRGDMLALLQKDVLDSSEIETLIRFAVDGGGIEYAYDTMRRLRDEAAALLERFPASPVRDAFLSLIDYIIAREN